MLLRRALPAARQSLAHPFRIFELGSRSVRQQAQERRADNLRR